MAKFEESKIITTLHPERAGLGKKYWYSDNLVLLRKYVENNNTDFVGELKHINNDDAGRFYTNSRWEFLYPYEEQKQRMTYIQLMEWLSKGNGVYKYTYDNNCCSVIYISEDKFNEEVRNDIVIRTWDSDEWVEPIVDIYKRDCKGVQ